MNHVTGLDKEDFAMRTPIQATPTISIRVRPAVRRDRPPYGDDSPYAPYLRRWLARSAVQHRDLLLNIDAAARIGLAPVLVSS
jgi:hypothetical protein